MAESDTEHLVPYAAVSEFVEDMLCSGIEREIGGRLIDEIKKDVDGHKIVLANGQVFRVAIFEVKG